MRASLAALAALAFAACSHSERPIGIQPTPLYVRAAQEASQGLDLKITAASVSEASAIEPAIMAASLAAF